MSYGSYTMSRCLHLTSPQSRGSGRGALEGDLEAWFGNPPPSPGQQGAWEAARPSNEQLKLNRLVWGVEVGVGVVGASAVRGIQSH